MILVTHTQHPVGQGGLMSGLLEIDGGRMRWQDAAPPAHAGISRGRCVVAGQKLRHRSSQLSH